MSSASVLETRGRTAARGRWFSDNPDKAWVEKFFLLYSPVWMASMAAMVVTGWGARLGDTGMLIHAFATALPAVLVPMALARRYTDRPWHDSYWFKANLYLVVFGFFGNYFGSEYFFDVLGMVYNYPNITSTLDATLVGSGRQTVPVIMYALTHIYFMTYHASATVVLRRLRSLAFPALGPAMGLLFPVMVLVIAYFWAWMETKAMANPMMAGTFEYRDLGRMLAWGSAIYATYFIASFPIYYFIDEDGQRRWNWVQVTAGALSASMLTFYMLDFAAGWVGTL